MRLGEVLAALDAVRSPAATRSAAAYFGAQPGDPRVPDLFGVVQHGVVYTGGHGKIAEDGGADPDRCRREVGRP